MKKISHALLLLMVSLMSCFVLTACPDEPQPGPDPDPDPAPYPTPSPDPAPGPSNGSKEDQILGTWYYMNSIKTLKLTFTFSDSPHLLGKEVTKTTESTFPSIFDPRLGDWTFKDGVWTFLFDAFGVFGHAEVRSISGNEMWVQVQYSVYGDDRVVDLKFTRNNPGEPQRPEGMTLVTANPFKNTVWTTTYGTTSLTCSFGTDYVTEKSDSRVYIYESGTWTTESKAEYIFVDGQLIIDATQGLLPNLIGFHYLAVSKESSNKLLLFNPFAPDNSVVLTRTK